MTVYKRTKAGLTDRFPLTMTRRRYELLHRLSEGILNDAMIDEPAYGLSKRDWRDTLKLMEAINLAAGHALKEEAQQGEARLQARIAADLISKPPKVCP
jgi:hypothetical protein